MTALLNGCATKRQQAIKVVVLHEYATAQMQNRKIV